MTRKSSTNNSQLYSSSSDNDNSTTELESVVAVTTHTSRNLDFRLIRLTLLGDLKGSPTSTTSIGESLQLLDFGRTDPHSRCKRKSRLTSNFFSCPRTTTAACLSCLSYSVDVAPDAYLSLFGCHVRMSCSFLSSISWRTTTYSHQ